MNRYTIYCTEEQTKKALELGAPLHVITAKDKNVIKAFKAFTNGRRKNECTVLENFQPNGDHWCKLITIPTAEQIIGWLEGKGIYLEPRHTDDNKIHIWVGSFIPHPDGKWTDSHPSGRAATLAAIDAALNYLIQMKGNDND